MLDGFACFFVDFGFFSKSKKKNLSECQTVWIQIRPYILQGLIWIQSVCKDYQQLAGKELKCSLHFYVSKSSLLSFSHKIHTHIIASVTWSDALHHIHWCFHITGSHETFASRVIESGNIHEMWYTASDHLTVVMYLLYPFKINPWSLWAWSFIHKSSRIF